MDMRIEFSNISGSQTAAHIHGFAGPGSNAGVRFDVGVGNPRNATWFFAEADEANILAGRTYVNIHTSVFRSWRDPWPDHRRVLVPADLLHGQGGPDLRHAVDLLDRRIRAPHRAVAS